MINKILISFMVTIFLIVNFGCHHESKPTKDKTTLLTEKITDTILTAAPEIAATKETFDSFAYPDNEKSIVQILQTGNLNADEVNAGAANKKWFGIFKIGNMFFLRATDLEIIPSADTINNIAEPVLMVNTSVFNRCLILISGLDDLKAKDLQTAQRIKDTIFPGEQIEINFKNTNYKIKAEGLIQGNSNGSFSISNYKLFLISTKNSIVLKQLLVAQPTLKNQMISILWTGDLDGDNNLDLIINASPTKGISTPALYLSSKAGKDELAKFSGQHFAKGV